MLKSQHAHVKQQISTSMTHARRTPLLRLIFQQKVTHVSHVVSHTTKRDTHVTHCVTFCWKISLNRGVLLALVIEVWKLQFVWHEHADFSACLLLLACSPVLFLMRPRICTSVWQHVKTYWNDERCWESHWCPCSMQFRTSGFLSIVRHFSKSSHAVRLDVQILSLIRNSTGLQASNNRHAEKSACSCHTNCNFQTSMDQSKKNTSIETYLPTESHTCCISFRSTLSMFHAIPHQWLSQHRSSFQ